MTATFGHRPARAVTTFRISARRTATISISARTARTSTSTKPFKSKIEIERKINPTPILKARLGIMQDRTTKHNHFGGDCSLHFHRLVDQRIRDVYLDRNNSLSATSLWIWYRESSLVHAGSLGGVESQEWEAKVRIGGDDQESEFVEIEGRKLVEQALQDKIPGVDLTDLVHMADLLTHRQSWTVLRTGKSIAERSPGADGLEPRMTVVLDLVTAPNRTPPPGKASFRHMVAELEVTAEIIGGRTEAEHEWLRKGESQKLRAYFQKFVAAHANLFDEKPMAGKLSAFFEWQGG